MSPDGGSRTAVDRNELDGCPAWSPDGSRLLFSRENALYVVDANGAGEHVIATAVGNYDAEPAWSPDGARIAFSKQGRVYVMRADGHGAHLLARGESAAWSSDGRRLAFARGGEIYVVAARGGRAIRATRARMHAAGHPARAPLNRSYGSRPDAHG